MLRPAVIAYPLFRTLSTPHSRQVDQRTIGKGPVKRTDLKAGEDERKQPR